MHMQTSEHSKPLPDTSPMLKICGMKDMDSVLMAKRYGADAVGFITEVPVDTPRKIDRKTARELVASAPSDLFKVMVCMPCDLENALELIEYVGPDAVQLHGPMSTDDIGSIRKTTGVRLIKTIHIDNNTDVSDTLYYISGLQDTADAVLLDSKTGGKVGGTGTVHDWTRSRDIIAGSPLPVILAGGLNPGNVAEAVKTVRPYGVDTASGVETGGIKDDEKVRMFIKNARSAL